MFRCFDGEQVDLDNPETYKTYPQTTKELRNLMFSEIGRYYCYMNYYRKDLTDQGCFKDQIPKIEELIKNFTENERENYENVMWYQEQVFIFQDETENLC
jgi:hypothetical protein